MDLSQYVPMVIGLLTPFVVKWGTDFALKLLPNMTGLGVLVLVLPVMAGIVTGITQYLTTAAPAWYWQLILSLLAVLVDQVRKQWSATPMQFRIKK